MQWIGLAPLLAHLIAMLLFFKIATIRVGFRQWWIAWSVLSSVAAAYSYGRARNVFLGAPFDLEAIVAPTYGAIGMVVFAAIIWNILKPRPHTAPVLVSQVIMDWRGVCISWSPAATDLLGWEEHEILHKELAQVIIPEHIPVTYEGEQIDAREAHRRGLQRFRETGESGIMNTSFETTALHKDGRHIDVEVRVTAHTDGGRLTFLGQLTLARKITV